MNKLKKFKAQSVSNGNGYSRNSIKVEIALIKSEQRNVVENQELILRKLEEQGLRNSKHEQRLVTLETRESEREKYGEQRQHLRETLESKQMDTEIAKEKFKDRLYLGLIFLLASGVSSFLVSLMLKKV